MFGRLKASRVGAAALAIACVGGLVCMQIPPAAASTRSIGSQLSAVASSPAGINAEEQFAKFATSSEVASAAQFLLSTQGQNLTGFQKSLLSLAPYLNEYSQAIQNRITGQHLSFADQEALVRLIIQFGENPAIQVLQRTGQRLKFSSNLASTLSGDVAALANPVTVVPSGSGIPQVDSFDAAEGVFATAADLPTLAPALTTIMQNPGFANFVRQAPPLVVASLIPGDQLWKLLLPFDHDPTVVDWVDFLGGALTIIIGTVAAIVGALGASVATIITLAVVGGLIAIGTLTFHFLSTIDCDHDGDPWDSADVAGNEC